MRTRIASVATLVMGLTLFGAMPAPSATAAPSADCSQGSAEEKMVCLNQKIAELEGKLNELTKDALKWNDRVSLVNEDMRIYPRCLDNAGPNAPDIAAVLASACAKTPAQSWMIRRPYQ
jgi:hypothetical protein